MRTRQTLLFTALLLAAALLGWLLPPAVFRLGDGLEEDRIIHVEIRQIDLNYQSDLDTASRLELLRRGKADNTVLPLERGIYLQREDAEDVCEDFLQRLTGRTVSLDNRCDVTPALLSFAGEGTVIAWIVTAYPDELWSWECVIDDQTGLILRGSLTGPPGDWSSLFPDFRKAEPESGQLADRLAAALCGHYAQRLDETLDAGLENETLDEWMLFGELALSKDGVRQYRIPIEIVVEEGRLSVN